LIGNSLAKFPFGKAFARQQPSLAGLCKMYGSGDRTQADDNAATLDMEEMQVLDVGDID
jgi:hypothetical protein